jgi:hypothetical protein
MFEKDIKRIAVQLAVLMFFVVCFIAWASNLSPATTASRAAAVSIGVYILARIAGKLVFSVLMRALVNDQVRRRQQSKQKQ